MKHRYPLVIDAHLDIAYNAACFKRNYANSARHTREYEEGSFAERENGLCTVGLPDMMRGRVGIGFGTIFVEPFRKNATPLPVVYHNAQEAHKQAMLQLDWYHRWEETNPHVKLIKTRADLAGITSVWLDEKPVSRHPIGIVMLMEGADPIREPRELEMWHEHGVRFLGPAWTGTRYSGGTGAPGGLTDLGRELLEVMADCNVGLDISHMAEQAAREALDRFEGKTVVATHSNPQKITNTDRHLPDDVILGIAGRNGVIGTVLYNRFIRQTWSKGDPKSNVTLDDVVRCIDYTCQLTGSANHSAIGSDFDGGFGGLSIPQGLDTIRDLDKIGDALGRHGYTAEDIAKVLHGNWLRMLNQVLT